MRAYIHSFRGKPWNDECESAFRGFSKLGVECLLFSSNEEFDNRKREDIVVGGMLIMEHALKQYDVSIPNYNYPKELSEYLGRRIWTVKYRDLNKNILPVFIKPLEEKAAKGIVVYSLDDMSEYEHISPNAEILCSEPVDIVSEWRCFVRYGEVIGVQNYKGDKNVLADCTIIKEAVKRNINSPASYSLDFGVTEDGRTILIEMNDGFAIGSYGLDDELYAQFLYTRWAELVGVNDPWDFRQYKDEGITPWGTKYITYFKDKDGNPTTQENVYEFHIQEYDSEGRFIQETIAFGKNQNE